ncbi:hypothetical protein FRACYDRAFT_238602 [Fragilariopsis cylindrus CCMP1102]|uniref:Uncharacterized protein n=1 Tax=Fragilariopsis cylindrus CCMP1102 TaxID=635003 RepID=A0A1E7FCZ9_9STRA|nr:hypothetical protein FRACYDRAFT_238602 [Fragilariopsis cylindrus CCMP1102]|eukprot:OEU16019.1 hypothetical protein FRACYDRAFT_238602 [Fragilariopsis cylindrus CCMP1102]
MATTGPASGGVPSSSAAVAAAAAVSTAPNSVMSTPAITSSSSVADGIASSAATGTAIVPTPNYSKRKYIAFWDSDGAGVDSWIGKITGPFQNVVAPTTATATTTPTSTTDDNNNNIKKEQEDAKISTATKKKNAVPPEITKQTWNNLRKAIGELRFSLRPPDADTNTNNQGQDDADANAPPAKRQKLAAEGEGGAAPDAISSISGANIIIKKKPKEFYTIVDPYNLYRHAIRIIGDDNFKNNNNNNEVEDEDPIQIEDDAARDLKTTTGGGQPGGIVNKKIQTLSSVDSKMLDAIPTAGNASLGYQSVFVLDRKNGDVICSSCGTVNSESLMHEGSQFRKFEGEADRNHHGDTQNPLYSNAHNMSTTLGGIQQTSGAGVGGFGSQRGRGLETVLRNAHAYTELNISQFGKGDRRTRTGYKDKQKKDAFVQMAHVGDALSLHEAVVQRGKELFAGFRDDRELIQQFKGVIAACLCESFEQLSSAGRNILKQKQEAPAETLFANPRANRRNELHHAKLAGKGGLLLDMDGVKKEKGNEGDESLSLAKKTISSWSLEDCRSWFLEVSRSVAQAWVDERKKGAKNIPEGSIEELEGVMVEHSITLCDKLEAELSKKQTASSGGRKRVVTPRVNDMAKLGIKWQHAHERGSGGKGGVGGSGKSQPQRGRTAGQILILKSSKKLGLMVDNKIAGEAIHKELRSLVNKQEALKRQKLRDEATRQRLVQMKRKPWLQARAMIND